MKSASSRLPYPLHDHGSNIPHKLPQGIAVQRFKLFLLAGLLACGLLSATAGATPVRFNIDGQFDSPTAGAFTGSMDVDTDLGEILSITVVFPGLSPFDILKVSIAQVNKMWRVRADNASRDLVQFFFTTPNASGPLGSLIDFDGGVIFSGTAAGPGISPNYTDFSGSIMPASVNVPEPTALGMFGAGVLLLGLFVGLRRRHD